MLMLLDEPQDGSNLAHRQAMTLRNIDPWLKPHLRLALLVLNVDMNPRLLPGEKEEPESSLPKNGGAHDLRSIAIGLLDGSV
jgi:hypothetical protein